MFCEDFQNPAKKKRLNLRSRDGRSKTRNLEHNIQNTKDTDSSEDTKKQQDFSIKKMFRHNKLDDVSQNDNKKNDDKKNDGASSERELQDSSLKMCPICKCDFLDLVSDTEINEHINTCLDSDKSNSSNPSELCQICWKDISKYNTIQCQQHLNRCCDNVEGANELNQRTKPDLFLCPICGKRFKTTKSRQTHMKKCAKENDVSTTQLVELNRRENTNKSTNIAVSSTSDQGVINGDQNTRDIFEIKRQKRKVNLPVPAKNLDDETQLALALSLSMQHDNDDVRGPSEKGKKKKKEKPEVPALLLRSDDETKQVTEARAAAILCQWVDNDDEIQCTPALAPSSLVKKYGSDSNSADGLLEKVAEETECADIEDITERCHSPTIEVRCSSNSKKEDKCGCENESAFCRTTSTHAEEIKKYFTVDTQTRLWKLTSLRTDVVTNDAFYVPNLLPMSMPCKKKLAKLSNTTSNEEQPGHCATEESDNMDLDEGSSSKGASQNDKLTDSQERNIEMLVALVSDESSDALSNEEEAENEDIDKTWFPSSGFCVRKDVHDMEDENKEHVATLLNDLTCMVGNPLLSDVQIVAKNNKKLCAHSFMLSARCNTLAEILQTSEICQKDDERSNLIRVELVDVDVRAVRAVLTYIYTATFIPVLENVLEDVKKLVHRWNLNCDADKWEVIRDRTKQDNEDNVEDEDNKENLDVLLKSLWEGEEEIVTEKIFDENVFGDSVLDDELGDMEIKIYTQVTPKKNTLETNNTSDDLSAVKLDMHSEETVGKMEKTRNDANFDNDEESTLEETDNENAIMSQNSDEICIPETPLNLSPCSSLGNHDDNVECTESEITLVEQSPDGGAKSSQSNRSGVATDLHQVVSSPYRSSVDARDFIVGHIVDPKSSSPVSLSPSSSVEMLSSPERSPLADNLNNYDMEDETCDLDNAQNTPEKINNSSIFNRSGVFSSTEKYLDENITVGNILDTCVLSPESASLPICSPKTDGKMADTNKDYVENTAGLQTCGAKLVTVATSCRKRTKSLDEKDDSLLDIFSSPNSETDPSLLCNVNVEDIVMEVDETSTIEANTASLRKNRRSCDRTTTQEDVTRRQSKNKVDSWLNDSSSLSQNTPNTEATNWEQENVCDGQFIDCFDDGGFNCDINDYLISDAVDTFERENVVPDEVKRGTSSTAQDVIDSSGEEEKSVKNNEEKVKNSAKRKIAKEMNNLRKKENETEMSKNVMEGKNSRKEGETRQPGKEVSSKKTKVNVETPQVFKLRDPRTPMLDYSNMATPELKVELEQFGVRPLPKRKMVVKLKEMYSYTHREIYSESESDEVDEKKQCDTKQQSSENEYVQARDTNSQQGSTHDSESDTESAQHWYDDELSNDSDLSQKSSSNLSKRLMTFLREDNELYFKILKYMPISVSDVLDTIKNNGIKCSAKQLKDFLDEQCITYSEPRPARVQKRGRRRRR